MSRGFGRHQRLILAELKETEAFYLSDLFPPDDQQKPFARRGHETSEVVALRRAARSLGNAGKIARYYDGGVRRRLVIARPGARLSTGPNGRAGWFGAMRAMRNMIRSAPIAQIRTIAPNVFPCLTL
jgi:hypothetical protein